MAAIVIWNQHYFLFGHGLAFSATIAALPIFTLLFLLGVMRKSAWVSGLAGLAASIAKLLLVVFVVLLIVSAFSGALRGRPPV